MKLEVYRSTDRKEREDTGKEGTRRRSTQL